MSDTLRPFDDLIKVIEVDGNKIIPAVELAQLCFNYNKKTVTGHNVQMHINNSYDYAMHYSFDVPKLAGGTHCYIVMYRSFNIHMNFEIKDTPNTSNMGIPVSNQVQIFFLLMKWGFIKNEINS